MRSAIPLVAAPALAAAAAFQPTQAAGGDGIVRALERMGVTATPWCMSLLDLPKKETKTETVTPTDTVYVVVATVTTFDSNCATALPQIAPRDAGDGFGFGVILPLPTGFIPKELQPFPPGLLSSACSEFGQDIFPWKTIATTVTKTLDVPAIETVEVVESETVCTGTVCLADGSACDPEKADECCGGACGTTDNETFFCFQKPKKHL
ncbi:hypothetical protein B0T16DRAFT_423486 [Cercophora newfieldiana]|uniref:Uncharacterized protein n=1 Tax=Cercophora newfieldiana TaxID=92897 RepID=A0AA39XSV5_9PEZI|nr:hypothetical protein B0T16DRAFT_423486 [Cercophora newfieldiana]